MGEGFFISNKDQLMIKDIKSKEPASFEKTVKNALTPDHHSQAAYTGRVKQTETVIVFAEDGTPIQGSVDVYISWASIVQILAMVGKRIGIKP
jgi:hypothetical protein